MLRIFHPQGVSMLRFFEKWGSTSAGLSELPSGRSLPFLGVSMLRYIQLDIPRTYCGIGKDFITLIIKTFYK
ncbi:MAG: hypothetical protein EA411_12690 [Saprospirales bacterium]|nr:MAG: hypothetical protein EA411_12690 [Saprospirales bacterium]